MKTKTYYRLGTFFKSALIIMALASSWYLITGIVHYRTSLFETGIILAVFCIPLGWLSDWLYGKYWFDKKYEGK